MLLSSSSSPLSTSLSINRLLLFESNLTAARCALTRYVNNDVHAWNSIDCERSATEIRRIVRGSSGIGGADKFSVGSLSSRRLDVAITRRGYIPRYINRHIFFFAENDDKMKQLERAGRGCNSDEIIKTQSFMISIF